MTVVARALELDYDAYGVVKTKLEGARWTHWLKIPYISYD